MLCLKDSRLKIRRFLSSGIVSLTLCILKMFLSRSTETERKIIMIKTNIGEIPLEDYLDIVASSFGFDSYEDLKKSGYSFDNKNIMKSEVNT